VAKLAKSEWWLSHMIPMTTKLTTYAAKAGHRFTRSAPRSA
jgi:hypothetical protein